jgi:hypothetical protein
MVRDRVLIFRSFDLALDDDATPGSVVRHVHAVLGDDGPRRIWLEATGRRAAELTRRVLAIAPAMSVAPIDAATIERVADGVPHDLPLTHANVYWGPVPALLRTDAPFAPARDAGGPLADVQGAEVRIFCVASRTPIMLELAAGVIDDAPPAAATSLPALPPLVAALARKITPRDVCVIGSPDELAAMRALDVERDPIERPLVERVRTAAQADIYPHAIASDPHVRSGALSIKAAFGPPLAALGYRAGRRGTREEHRFARRTPRDNELAIFVRRGARYGGLHAALSIGGPLWTVAVHVPIAPGVDTVTIWTDDTMRRVADNVAFAAKRIEDELLAVVEPARPRGCAWYSRDAS